MAMETAISIAITIEKIIILFIGMLLGLEIGRIIRAESEVEE